MRDMVLSMGIALACLIMPETAAAQTYGNNAFSKAFGPCRGDTCIIRSNPGGELTTFLKAAAAVRAGAKRLVVIDGPCYSACAIFADMTRDKVCVTDRASFGFHKARVLRSVGPEGGKQKWRHVASHDPRHSRDIASWVRRNGGFPSKGFIVMKAPAAAQYWRLCRLQRL